jgi:hypothetical protein
MGGEFLFQMSEERKKAYEAYLKKEWATAADLYTKAAEKLVEFDFDKAADCLMMAYHCFDKVFENRHG